MRDNVTGLEEAIKLCESQKSPAYKRLEAYQSWVDGTQYRGRPSWWSDCVPQWEREPCIVYPVVRKAVLSNTDLMLGERPFPQFSMPTDEEGEKSPYDDPLQKAVKFTRFKTLAREAFTSAQSVGAACAVFGVRNKRTFGDLIPAKWCQPEFVAPGSFEVKKLVIQYPYLDEQKQQDGTWLAVCKVYRREITDSADITYKPATVDDADAEIKWRKDGSQTIEHGLGFCPVVWYPFMRGCAAINVIHGRPIHEGITDEIQAHDISRSQWHKVALYSEPQIVEIGVSMDHNPTGTGRPADIPSTEKGGPINPNGNPQNGAWTPGGYANGAQSARKKGSGNVWRYSDPQTRVEYLTIPESAMKALEGDVKELRQQITDALGVVFLEPDNIKFASVTSGKALEAIRQKQLDRIDQYKPDFRDGFMIPSIGMMLRVSSQGVRTPGFDALTGIDVDSLEFELETSWGEYQEPDTDDQAKVVDMVAKSSGMVPPQVLRRKLQTAGVYDLHGDVAVDDNQRTDTKALLEELEILNDVSLESKTLMVEAIVHAAQSMLPGLDESAVSRMRSELEKSADEPKHEHETGTALMPKSGEVNGDADEE